MATMLEIWKDRFFSLSSSKASGRFACCQYSVLLKKCVEIKQQGVKWHDYLAGQLAAEHDNTKCG